MFERITFYQTIGSRDEGMGRKTCVDARHSG
jgi:hypothetical protein